MKQTSHGFTLVELAVALTIVALVIGGLAVPLSKRLSEQQYTDTQANIDKAVEALVGFAILNRRLPCPDVNTASAGNPDTRDGIEDIAGASGAITGCSIGVAGTAATSANYHSDADGVSWGDLPYQTLGLASPNNADAWNNRLRYAVFTPLVTQVGTISPPAPAVPGTVCSGNFGLSNLGCTTPTALSTANAQLDIRCGNPVTTTVATAAPGCLSTSVPPYSVSQNAVLVVYSVGANGWGSTSIVNLATAAKMAFTTALQTSLPDQAINATEVKSSGTIAGASALRRQFVVRARTDGSSGTGEFDDLLTFMSSPMLASRLMNAGVWP